MNRAAKQPLYSGVSRVVGPEGLSRKVFEVRLVPGSLVCSGLLGFQCLQVLWFLSQGG